ncbi:MAG: KAP family NTPase [Alphaproteobacteria bacterium]|nr:KAP family NTPase [Alphaproteobacteria bacterium]
MSEHGDVPEDRIQFHLAGHADHITKMIAGPRAPPAFLIDGEQNSEKTTLMNMINGRLGSTAETITVNGWTFEKGTALASLLCLAREHIPAGVIRQYGMANPFSYAVLVGAANMEKADAVSRLKELSPGTVDMEAVLSGAAGKKLVIFIDDLDVYDTENTLGVLESAGLLLSTGNVIVVAAADMGAARSHWEAKYGKSDYSWPIRVGEMFHQVSIPPMSEEEMARYIISIYPVSDRRAAELARMLPRSPGKARAAVKLASHVIRALGISVSDPARREMIYATMAIFSVRAIGGCLERMTLYHRRDFVYAAWLCSSYGSHSEFKDALLKTRGWHLPVPGSGVPAVSMDLATASMLRMIRTCSADPRVFRILQQYGLRIRDCTGIGQDTCISALNWRLLEPVLEIFNEAARVA